MESKAESETLRRISALAEKDPAVIAVKRPHTVRFAPDQILLNLSIKFKDGPSEKELAQT